MNESSDPQSSHYQNEDDDYEEANVAITEMETLNIPFITPSLITQARIPDW